ncbi:hypothetical protein OsJ_21766 [Oryza sativa Japonica Group]|uniref:Uncharacterized protein n=1 Tax=Oryza sativa subsp. japonica TaxID=39947 RepID=B9FTV4_ORYSJ|nr:hypothetical protein OsJ_21766 [Oryza sativa Japonica Group]
MQMHPRDDDLDLAAGEAAAPVKSGDGGETPTMGAAMDKERQIPVDPVSLRHLGMVADEDSPLSAPSVLTEVVVRSSSPMLPPLRRPTFVAASLPCSATSSPVHGAAETDKPAAATPSPTAAMRALARQHSVALAHYKSFAAAAAAVVSSMQRQQSVGARPRRSSSVSRLASLERFECGSWSPPPPMAPAEHLAQEVAKSSCADDTEAPVKMAFVFDHGEPRGILKKSASSRQEPARPSASSSQRHVRFSTAAAAAAASCPTSPCVTPRLARARAEFNAFLEAAQSA